MITDIDHEWMARAIRLAERGLYTTDPNPRVGCVVVHSAGEIAGEGWHQYAGGPHAEIHALNAAGERARGATAYVSLEPCCHQGRTPPCTDALIKAGIARVVIASEDPNPLVAGKGVAQLTAAGVLVDSGVLQSQAAALNPGFIKRMRHGRPYVRCKLAMSLDGRTALANGASQWISGEAARRDVQRLRARSSAIVTGIGTVLADDPSLTVRLVSDELHGMSHDGDIRQPLRVVVDSNLRMPAAARMFTTRGKILIATATHNGEARVALEALGAKIVILPQADDGVDLGALLTLLAHEHVNEVLVEAGSSLCGALLQRGLVDELILYVASVIMGDTARGLFHLPAVENLAECARMEIVDVRPVGSDWRITARVV